jgi:hypothetical protein
MPGLDPGIRMLDCRVKPGNDDLAKMRHETV